jgi:hypothetical protein
MKTINTIKSKDTRHSKIELLKTSPKERILKAAGGGGGGGRHIIHKGTR